MFRLLIPLLYVAFLAVVMFNIWDSPYHSQQEKFMWMGFTLFFPGIGVLAWLLIGKRRY